MSKKNRGKVKSGAVSPRTARRRAAAAAARNVPPAPAVPADKVPQQPEQNAKQALPLGAAVNGNGAGSAQVSAGMAERLAAVSEQGHRHRMRGVVYEMLGDGSLLEGLQRALETNARDRYADPRADVGNQQAEKQRFEKNYARGAGSSSPGAPPTRPPSDRYRQFLDVQDVEIDRLMNLIAGLEDRLAFIVYDGPSEATNQATASGEVHVGPTNRLETELFDRARRLAIVRERLEQLHTNLRI